MDERELIYFGVATTGAMMDDVGMLVLECTAAMKTAYCCFDGIVVSCPLSVMG